MPRTYTPSDWSRYHRKDTRKRIGDRHSANYVRPIRDRRNYPDIQDGQKALKRFIAIDGEGWDTDDMNRQHYQLMAGADSHGNTYALDTGAPLNTLDIVYWLFSLPPAAIVIAFSFGYDTTMLIKDLPNDLKLSLWDRESRKKIIDGKEVFSLVWWQGFGFDWIPGKILKIRSRSYDRSIQVHDVFGFFQQSFLKAVTNWEVYTPEELEIVREGKGRRNDGGEHSRSEEMRYSQMECLGLSRMMDKVRELCFEVGYPLRSYSGAGSIASAMLRVWKVRDCIEDPPKAMSNPVSRAFFGGRFDTAILGVMPKVYYADIVSAYPSVIKDLPCLVHGRWSRVRKYRSGIKLALWRCSWSVDPESPWTPFPYRTEQGNIRYPAAGCGWYWSPEVDAAKAMFGDEITIDAGWVFYPGCEELPFHLVPSVFEERKIRKAASDPAEKVLKLGLNSLYGKTAQTVGDPPFASYVYAGFITAATRAKLLRAIIQAPNAIVATATDSISSLVPLDLAFGESLGEWEISEPCEVFQAGNGLSLGEHSTRTKTRGARPDEVDWSVMKDQWYQHGIFGTLPYQRTQFIGLATACARGKPQIAGEWVESTRTQTFNLSARLMWSEEPVNAHAKRFIYQPLEDPSVLSATYKKIDIATLLVSDHSAANELLENWDAKDGFFDLFNETWDIDF
jgi:hypothetical protein